MVQHFLGLRGTGDWVANQVPESWREYMLFLNPNGDCPLTGLTSKLKTKPIKSYKHHWFTKLLSEQTATITGVYTDSGLSTPYVSGGATGDTLYIKMSAADSKQFRAGHTGLIRVTDDLDVDVAVLVTASTQNGSSSYLTVKLLEADDNSSGADLSDADIIMNIGSAHAEGASFPDAVSTDPDELDNLSQIFRTPYTITGTAEETELRTGDSLKEERREKLLYHGVEMEMAFWFGKKSSGTGSNGKPLRTLDGIIPMVKTNAPSNVFNYLTDTSYAGKTWLEGGEDFMDAKLEVLFRLGRTDKMAFGGSGALLGLSKLAKRNGYFQIGESTTVWGLKLKEYMGQNGRLFLAQHPLFTQRATCRNMLVAVELENITYCPLRNRDTKHLKQREDDSYNGTGIDGRREEWLTECTLEIAKPQTFGVFYGIGQDNTLS